MNPPTNQTSPTTTQDNYPSMKLVFDTFNQGIDAHFSTDLRKKCEDIEVMDLALGVLAQDCGIKIASEI